MIPEHHRLYPWGSPNAVGIPLRVPSTAGPEQHLIPGPLIEPSYLRITGNGPWGSLNHWGLQQPPPLLKYKKMAFYKQLFIMNVWRIKERHGSLHACVPNSTQFKRMCHLFCVSFTFLAFVVRISFLCFIDFHRSMYADTLRFEMQF